MRKWISIALVCLVAVFSSGCGDGTGTGSRAETSQYLASTETFNLRSAWINFLQRPRALVVDATGQQGGAPYTSRSVSYQSPLFITTFEGRQVWGQIATTEINASRSGGAVTGVLSSVVYYDGNFNYLGDSGDAYSVADSSLSLPDSVRVGDRGLLYTATIYADASKTNVLGTERMTYVIEPDSATSVVVALNLEVIYSNGAGALSDVIRHRLTSTGVMTLLSETTRITGSTPTTLFLAYQQPSTTPGNVPASTQTFNLRSAYVSDLQRPQFLQADITGSDNGVPVTGLATISTSSLYRSTFENQTVLSHSTDINMQLVRNGEPLAIPGMSISHYDANYNWLGASGDAYYRANTPTAIPQSVRTGDGGLFRIATVFEDASRTVISGTDYTTFIIEPDIATSAILVLNTVSVNTRGTVIDSSLKKYRLTTTGSLTRLSETVTEVAADPITLTLTYRQP